ncbi:Acyl-CoA synthetase (AMP-forming)/AMP-acid ligase II [Sinosporangium album]|uniref:Acyl-CoA synthetase (AMP-forming)/AMP-acid ligase II n=2 Tax=Sinosporangium album TaxID=504805 RepID=A0A1G7RYR8_9ACTN|nr:Acyl-CoA synthetase (AMP-forming)/AMP-acid ligase II [Sinosporangium album]
MSRTVTDLLSVRAAAEPGRIALVVPGVGALSAEEWDGYSSGVAAGLLEHGVAQGDRVALVFGNHEWIDYAVAYCAVLKAGAVAVPLSDRLAPVTLRETVRHAGATATICGSGLDGSLTLADLDTGHRGALPVTVEPDDPAQILYTSGTTGKPKGVVATHANLTHGSAPSARRRAFTHSRHLLHAFPIGTNAGQVMLFNALDAHPTVVAQPRFTAERFARLIAEHRAGTVFVVPAMAIELLASGALERHDTSSLLLLGSAAAPLPAAVAAGLARALPRATIANYYTSTEAAPAQTIMIFDPERPGSVGRPSAGGNVRVADEDGCSVPIGTTGEVWLRSAATTRAYYGDPEATRSVFDGGWIRMGDLGYVDDEGYLYLVDRDSDVIKSGAYKVSTLRVEEALYEHPGIVEAAAFGTSHPVLGTTVSAAVVSRTPIAPEALRAFLLDRLAQHELPTRVHTIRALPRNSAGKVDKRLLRAMCAMASDRTETDLP